MHKKRATGEAVSVCQSSHNDRLDADLASRAVLNYILSHAKGDCRPFLEVLVYGRSITGLLDSGSSRTILGRPGWDMLQPFCQLTSENKVECAVANGQICRSIGSILIPFQLRDKVVLLDVLVIPALPHHLILGVDFWRKMEIVPDLYSGQWSFKSEISRSLEISALQSLDNLTTEQRQTLDNLLNESFLAMGTKLGCTNLVQLVIKTESAPIKQRYYPLSHALQKIVNEELDKMLADDIVEPSDSPWSSPIVMIRKKSGDWRFCVDYRSLNRVTVPDAYPIPYVSATLDKLRDAKYLSTLDIKSAYWQIPIAPESRPLTAFTVPTRGLFQFKRMPFGLTNAPAVWQRLIDRVVGVDLEKHVFVYLDDVIICTPTFDEHVTVLKEVMKRIFSAGLTLNREKCQFCKPELKYLGYVINASGLLVDPEKVEAILKIPTPKSVSEVRRIVGMASWYRRFVPNFSTVISPLTSLTRKNVKFHWDSNCEKAFQTVKEHLIKAPVLSCPNFNLPFVVQCDASDFGLGAVLSQVQNGEEHVISYLSRSLTKNERKYSTTEKECLAVIFAVEKLRPYLEGTKFTVVTDHYSLKWLNSIKDPVGRIARWALRLQQYDFDIVHRKGKDHVVPDALSRSVPLLDEVKECPKSDPWYSRMCQNVEQHPGKYPLWRVEGGKLYKRVLNAYPALSLSDSEWLIVAPQKDRPGIIKAHHDPPTCGHLGVYKTMSRIAQRFYWPKMRSDVARYIRRCTICLQNKPVQKPPPGHLLSNQPKTSRPWQIISIDLVGPLPRSSSGYSYILSVLDIFSKFTLFFPLRAATAPGIVRWLEDHVFLIYGAPDKIICDNGTQFRGKVFKDLMDAYDVEIKYTANYHPQANPVERVHRVLKTMLSSYVSEDHRQWDKQLAKIGAAVRSARHEVTGMTPNFIMFGREVPYHKDQRQLDTGQSIHSPVDPAARAKALEQVFQDVQKRIRHSHEKARKTYNLRRRDERFSLNQEVWKRNYVLSDATKNFTSKLAPKFLGPYIVHKIVSPWSYELIDSKGRNLGVWHAKDLKAHPPDDES